MNRSLLLLLVAAATACSIVAGEPNPSDASHHHNHHPVKHNNNKKNRGGRNSQPLGDTCPKGITSEICSGNPNGQTGTPFNYQNGTCNFKWSHGCYAINQSGWYKQRPPPYNLCAKVNGQFVPAGLLAVDWYTYSVQKAPNIPGTSLPYTLHGLWPGSQYGSGGNNQPYGCLNGQDYDPTYVWSSMKPLFTYFWPSDPQYNNTEDCFIASEWMKHGTCAVIPDGQGGSYRVPQEVYYRAAMVLLNEVNLDVNFFNQMGFDPKTFYTQIPVQCVACANWSVGSWSGSDPSQTPRMQAWCKSSCYNCQAQGNCVAAGLDPTVPSALPKPAKHHSRHRHHDECWEEADDTVTEVVEVVRVVRRTKRRVDCKPKANVGGFPNDLNGSMWRSYGAEKVASGKYEFNQLFTSAANTFQSSADSPFPMGMFCTPVETYIDPVNPTEHAVIRNCVGSSGGATHEEYCLVQRLPDVGGMEVAFFACNHTGAPAPVSFIAAMDPPPQPTGVHIGNFLMFRCRQGVAYCNFHNVTVGSNKPYNSHSGPASLHDAKLGKFAGAPNNFLARWRSFEVSQYYNSGIVNLNVTSDGLMTVSWAQYPQRPTVVYTVTYDSDTQIAIQNVETSAIRNCLFEFHFDAVYSYAALACGPEGGAAPPTVQDGFKAPNLMYAMGRCNPGATWCTPSCDGTNNNCGTGTKKAPRALRWCTPGQGCWPSSDDIEALYQALDPLADRTGLRFTGGPLVPAPAPKGSFNNLPLYGLGQNQSLSPLYTYGDDINSMYQPCFTGSNPPSWNFVSDMCKAAVHGNEYQNWNPFIVVFPLNESHVRSAVTFALNHQLCISIMGSGHEYNARSSCPTGGIMIRLILLKQQQFIPSYPGQDYGAFKFGAGVIFPQMHSFANNNSRAVSSGWCPTVGMIGWHLGGGHGPYAPSMGLGVDNLLEAELLLITSDGSGAPVIYKTVANNNVNSDLFWAMRGGGGGVWGVILSMTIRAHPMPQGGLSRMLLTQTGTFCQKPGSVHGYDWLRGMFNGWSTWVNTLNTKVSTQPGFFPDTSKVQSADPCTVSWNFQVEIIYAGPTSDADYVMYRDAIVQVLDNPQAVYTQFATPFDYLASLDLATFTLNPTNPLAAPFYPSDNAVGSQSSVLVLREKMPQFPSIMMQTIDLCIDTLSNPDPTSPSGNGYRCGFSYLYAGSLTGNIGSARPSGLPISNSLRNAVMLWNSRTLTTNQMYATIFQLANETYFSESPFVLHNWTSVYWGQHYASLAVIKARYDPLNVFWCHHCVGDDPNDPYGAGSE